MVNVARKALAKATTWAGVDEVPVDVLTVKSLVDIAVTPPTTTVIFPVVAPAGTTTVSEVAEAAETVAAIPLKVIVLLATVALKFVPVMATTEPTAPLVGEKLVIVGDAAVTVSSVLLQATTNKRKQQTDTNKFWFFCRKVGLKNMACMCRLKLVAYF